MSNIISEPQEECLICLETDLKDPIQLPCHHRFCSTCLDQWRSKFDLSSQRTCPTCRQKIPPSKEMLHQLTGYKQRLIDLKERLNSSEPFVFDEAIQRGGYSKMVNILEIKAIEQAPIELHDMMFRTCFGRVARGMEEMIQNREKKIGDYSNDQNQNQILLENSDEGLRIPSDIYNAAGFEEEDEDYTKALEWLGPPPIPKERIDAKNPDHMDNTFLHLAVKTDIGFVHYLLQHGADVNSKMVMGATPIETVVFRLEFDDVSRLLLEWGATKESNLMDMAQKAEEDGNLKLAHLLRTPLGGRRCEIVGLAKRSDLNGKFCIAGKYVQTKDRYIISVEETQEEVLIRTTNLKRRDRTPENCGYVVRYDEEKDVFEKKFTGP